MIQHFAPAAKSAKNLRGGAKSKTTRRRNFLCRFCRFCTFSLERYARVYLDSPCVRPSVPPSGETLPNPQNAQNRPAVWRFGFGSCEFGVPNGANLLPNRGDRYVGTA